MCFMVSDKVAGYLRGQIVPEQLLGVEIDARADIHADLVERYDPPRR